MHYNEIIRQTSSDRSHVDTVINTLEKSQLIMERKISQQERKLQKIHSQAKVMGNTDAGREIALFSRGVERYQKAYSAIVKTVNENFTFGEDASENEVKSILQSKNWAPNEISSYKYWSQEAISFGLKSVNIYIIALLVRYIEMLSRDGANELVRDVLSTIFTDAINWHFSNGIGEFVKILSSKKYGITPEQEQLINGMLRQFKKQVLNYISDCTCDYIPHMRPLSNKYIKDQASELTDSLYSIIEPAGDKDLLRSMITNLTGRRPSNVSYEEIERILNGGSS